ncbi:MAG: pantetheine-phosphate adenylyltransferase [Defluviitaleaceae bacterium]|nr:pantetheine-phosphate adenylyltransferase [Defluviitaleaceae bacterium]
MRVVYPGSFDPMTFGHLDIITRAANIADNLVVAVLNNPSKRCLFTIPERTDILENCCRHLKNVRVESFSGLLVDFAQKIGADAVIRGLRAVTDYEMEIQMAQTNKTLNATIETLFIATSMQFSYLSSSIVKEVASMGGKIDSMVPEYVRQRLYEKMRG